MSLRYFRYDLVFVQTPPTLSAADALVLVYAIDERRSYHYIQDVLQDIRRQDDHEGAVIMVANKADLVRTRDVEEEGEQPIK